jgi:acetyltransferase-like isoleucine patch superfamily enzyme
MKPAAALGEWMLCSRRGRFGSPLLSRTIPPSPKVGLYAATHPLDMETRRSDLEFGAPLSIGNDRWIGGHAVINPRVTLGNNVVVASGSVVTSSFGDTAVLAGVPAKVIRELAPDNRKPK